MLRRGLGNRRPVDHESGFALLMYDARNPANSPDGAVGQASAAVRSSLREPSFPPLFMATSGRIQVPEVDGFDVLDT